jgi:hypothetical protein
MVEKPNDWDLEQLPRDLPFDTSLTTGGDSHRSSLGPTALRARSA